VDANESLFSDLIRNSPSPLLLSRRLWTNIHSKIADICVPRGSIFRMLGQKELVEEGLSRMGLSNVTAAGPVRLSIDGSDLDFAPSTEDLIVL